MKENIISKETSEKTVLVGLITPQQNEPTNILTSLRFLPILREP